MFHVEHSLVQIIAHMLIAYLFICAGAVNAASRARSRQHAEHFASLGYPLPWLVLITGYCFQFIGGMMVLADWHADIGAIGLMVFTIVAMFSYHHYWRFSDPVRRNTARLFFINNCGVLGGLLLVAEPAFMRIGQ